MDPSYTLDPGFTLANPGGSTEFDAVKLGPVINEDEENEGAETEREKELELRGALETGFDDLSLTDNDSNSSGEEENGASDLKVVSNGNKFVLNGNHGSQHEPDYGHFQQGYTKAERQDFMKKVYQMSNPKQRSHLNGHFSDDSVDLSGLVPELNNRSSMSSLLSNNTNISERPSEVSTCNNLNGDVSVHEVNHSEEWNRLQLQGNETFPDNTLLQANGVSLVSTYGQNGFHTNGDTMDSNKNLPVLQFDACGDSVHISHSITPNQQQQLKLWLQHKEETIAEKEQALEEANRKLNIIKLQFNLSEDTNRKTSDELLQAQQLLSDVTEERNSIQRSFDSVQQQRNSEKKAKDELLQKFRESEMTIQALSKQVSQLQKSDSITRIQDQNENIISDLKFRHQKEVLKLQKEMDISKKNLNEKTEAFEKLKQYVTQLDKRHKQAQVEKAETVNRLSSNLETAQRKYKQLLESGKTSDVKKQTADTDQFKLELEHENTSLKEELNKLRNQMGANANRLELENDLEKLQRTTKSQRELILSLKNDLRTKASEALELTTKFEENEAALKEYHKKISKLEQESSESMIVSKKHQEEVNALIDDKEQVQKRLEETQFKLTNREAELNSRLYELQIELNQMNETKETIKNEALEECKDLYAQAHQNALQEFKTETDGNIIKLHQNYSLQIRQLSDEMTLLKDKLLKAEKNCMTLENECKILHSLQNGSEQNFRKELDAKIHKEYEDKFAILKELLLKEKREIRATLENEFSDAREEFVRNKEENVKKFIIKTEKDMLNNAEALIAKERSATEERCAEDIEKIKNEYKNKIAKLKEELEHEKKVFLAEVTKNVNAELMEKKTNIEQPSRKKESTGLRNEDRAQLISYYEDKLKQIQKEHENEIVEMNKNFNAQLNQEIDNLQELCMREITDQKQIFEQEINELILKSEQVNSEFEQRENKSKQDLERLSRKETDLENEMSLLRIALKQAQNGLKLSILENEEWKSLTDQAKETEKRLRDRIQKFANQAELLKKKHEEKMKNAMEKMQDSLKVLEDYKLKIASLETKLALEEKNKENDKNQVSGVPESVVANMKTVFRQTIHEILGHVNTFLNEYRRKSAEKFQRVVNFETNYIPNDSRDFCFKVSSENGQTSVTICAVTEHKSETIAIATPLKPGVFLRQGFERHTGKPKKLVKGKDKGTMTDNLCTKLTISQVTEWELDAMPAVLKPKRFEENSTTDLPSSNNARKRTKYSDISSLASTCHLDIPGYMKQTDFIKKAFDMKDANTEDSSSESDWREILYNFFQRR